MNRFFVFISLIAIGSLSSCIKQRSWSTPTHKHLYYEIEIKNDIRRKINLVSRVEDKVLYLKFESQKYCKHIQYDVEKLSINKTYQAPAAKYYMALGSLLMVLSLPSYYMGFFKSEGTPRVTHLTMGTGLFLLPGLALGGYALYKKLQEKVVTKDIGKTRRELKGTESKCGKIPLGDNHLVELLTESGYETLGRLGSDGRLKVDLSLMKPLYSESREKHYFEVFVQRNSVGMVYLPKKNKKEKETPAKKPVISKSKKKTSPSKK